jgi:glycosyltransferase involved in cell wall biosynthesis
MRVPRVSVVIPVLNSKATLRQCLDSVLEAVRSLGEGEIIAVDHGSTDGSYEMLSRDYGRVASICRQTGGTIASLRNFGARLAKGEYLCFVDSDCVLAVHHLKNAMKVFARVGPDATGCKYDLPPSPHWVEETWSRLHRRDKDGYVNYLNAGNFIIKKSVFDRIGGFDERLPTDEDADLGLRLLAAGFRIYEAHDVSAVHLGNPKSLVGFFRKELWHGSGMFKMRRRSLSDRILWATLLHGTLVAFAIVFAFLPIVPVPARAAIVLFALSFVPGAILAYRFTKLENPTRPLRSLLLYWIFFAAKVVAMVREIVPKRDR